MILKNTQIPTKQRHIKSTSLAHICKGIGLAVSHFVLQKPQSSKVVIVARSRQPLEDLKSQYPDDQVQVLSGDLTDFSFAKKAVELASSKWENLDGMMEWRSIMASWDQWIGLQIMTRTTGGAASISTSSA